MAEPDREARLRELFERAVGLGKAQQEELLAGISDELLRERLLALLLQDAEQTAGVLQKPLVGGAAPARQIGNYELLRTLGRGGMGVVMLARQVEPIERLVAIKLVADAEEGSELLQRFRGEQRALGRMNHPGVARVFDGGVTAEGQPYFVMEYVRGEAITDYCDRRRLSVAQRLRLVAQVCDAVQHAHQKGVIHRDLKPHNLLVSEDGGRPQVKVIDFGVARAIAGRLATLPATQVGAVVGTLLYMSPEQAVPDQEVDTRTDIYSLGVVAFELLVGQTPLVFGHDPASLLQFRTDLVEGRVPTAVTVAGRLDADEARARAERRASSVAAWRRELGEDIGWVLAKALDADRNRRYASASEFAADLLRYLAGEPVTARAPTWGYLLRRFVRRHRLAVLAAVLAVVGLVGGAAAAGLGLVAARAARDGEAAARQRLAAVVQRQRAVQEFAEFVQLYGDPGTGAAAPSLRQSMVAATAVIGVRWRDRPLERAAVRAALGNALLYLGEPTLARTQLQEAWDLLAGSSHDDPAYSLSVLTNLRRATQELGDLAAARQYLVRMLEFGALAVREEAPELAALLTRMAGKASPTLTPAPDFLLDCGRAVDLLVAEAVGSRARHIVGGLVFGLALAARRDDLPGSDLLLQRMEGIARQEYGDDVEFALVLGHLAENRLRLRDPAAAKAIADELLAVLARLDLTQHWLAAQAARIRGLALVAGGDAAAGEAELLLLRDRLRPFRATGNTQVRRAADALPELARGLVEQGLAAPFLAASFARWRAAGAPSAGWWPAGLDEAPAPWWDAALAVLEREGEALPRALADELAGALLLRLGRTEAALPRLHAALAGAGPPSPELLADVAIARYRQGDPQGAAAVLATLQQGAPPDASPALQARWREALARAQIGRR